jgi:flagellar export protein FliJ
MSPKFSLQPVLDYRHSHVEVLEVELGQIVHQHQEANETLFGMEEHQGRLTKELTSSQREGELDLEKVGQLRITLRSLAGRIEQQKQRIEELMRAEESKRTDLVQAKQDEEALATLKERETERFQEKEHQEENRLQDDIYIARAYRRSSEETPEE